MLQAVDAAPRFIPQPWATLPFDGAGFRELLDIAPVLEVELTRQLAWACSPETTLQLH